MGQKEVLAKLAWLGAMDAPEEYSDVLSTFSKDSDLLDFGDIRLKEEGGEIPVYDNLTKRVTNIAIPKKYFESVAGAFHLLEKARKTDGGRQILEDIQKKEEEKIERRVRRKNIMGKALLHLLGGSLLAGAVWFGVGEYNSLEAQKGRELDEVARYIIPSSGEKEIYEINGERIKVEKIESPSSNWRVLQIKLSDKTGFVSEHWETNIFTSDGDARNLEYVLVNNAGSWNVLSLEESGSPRDLQRAYESLLGLIATEKLKLKEENLNQMKDTLEAMQRQFSK